MFLEEGVGEGDVDGYYTVNAIKQLDYELEISIA